MLKKEIYSHIKMGNIKESKSKRSLVNQQLQDFANWWVYYSSINQKVEDNNIRNNIKNNTKSEKKSISNYTNQREYSEEFLNSLYANL